MEKFGNVGARATIAAVAALSIGSMCTPVSESTLEIENLTTKALFSSGKLASAPLIYGWRRDELTPASLPGFDPSITPRFETRLAGGWPMEAIFFDRSQSTKPVCQQRRCIPIPNGEFCFDVCQELWHPLGGTRYAMLPGLNAGVPKTTYHERTFEFSGGSIASARLIRHGACSFRIRATDVFKDINDAIWRDYRGNAWAAGASATQNPSGYQTSFLRDPESTSAWLGNEDGFSIFLSLRAEEADVGGVDTHAFASYSIGIKDGAASIDFVGGSGGDDFTGLAPTSAAVYPRLATALKDTLPARLHELAKGLATIVIKGPDGKTPFSCNPAACGVDPQRARLNCRGLTDIGFITELRKRGMEKVLAEETVAKLNLDQYDCRMDPALLKEGAAQEGVCTFRPNFKRAVVTPEYLEMVWYEDGEAPTPDYHIATLSDDPKFVPICLTSSTFKPPQPIPFSTFSHATEEGTCPTLVGCTPCEKALAKGCPLDPKCSAAPYHVGDTGYCGTCPEPGTIALGKPCVPGGPACAKDLLCWKTATPSSPTPTNHICLPAKHKPGSICAPGPTTCLCAFDLMSGTCK